MKYVKTFESFVNEETLFKQTLSPAQAAAQNIQRSAEKIDSLKDKMSEKPEESIYIKAQIEVEQEKIDVLKAQIRAETAKEQLASRKEFEKKQKERERKENKKD